MYFAFRYHFEWEQLEEAIKEKKAYKRDYLVSHVIGTFSILVFLIQKISNSTIINSPILYGFLTLEAAIITFFLLVLINTFFIESMYDWNNSEFSKYFNFKAKGFFFTVSSKMIRSFIVTLTIFLTFRIDFKKSVNLNDLSYFSLIMSQLFGFYFKVQFLYTTIKITKDFIL